MARRRTNRSTSPQSERVASQPAMARAIHAFLVAAGLDPSTHAELGQTPQLVARAWAEEFLDGYRTDPRSALADRVKLSGAPHDEMILVSNIAFQSCCPHHLLPYGGVAHVAYVPGRHAVGFGQIVRLLDCLGHRLILQEELARQVAETLTDALEARGAAVLLQAEQACLALRGGRRVGSRVSSEAYTGVFGRDAELRSRFLAGLKGG